MARAAVAFLVAAAIAASPAPAEAAEPIPLGQVRLTVSGEASVGAAPEDKGHFNEIDYRRNLLRTTRLGLALGLQVDPHVALLSEVRTENLDTPRVYALYLRLRPWPRRSFDLQVGRIPPVFGAFARRRYGPDNPLVGYPLAYQYLTTLRPGAAPANTDELLAVRGRGWAVRYGYGAPGFDAGMPLVEANRWDAGLELHAASQGVELNAALTQGTLSDPRVRDDNSGKQLSGRVAFRPLTGLVVGVSGARGPYLERDLERDLEPARPSEGHYQRGWGVDVEYSRGYGLVRAEAVWSEWDALFATAQKAPSPLRARGIMVEGRYKLVPGLYLAGRADHLGFSEIQGSHERLPWDAPLTRLEAGLGWSPTRHALLKAVVQHNHRDGGTVRTLTLVAAQALLWF